MGLFSVVFPRFFFCLPNPSPLQELLKILVLAKKKKMFFFIRQNPIDLSASAQWQVIKTYLSSSVELAMQATWEVGVLRASVQYAYTAALKCNMGVPELGYHQYKQLMVQHCLLFLKPQYSPSHRSIWNSVWFSGIGNRISMGLKVIAA